MSRKAGYLYCDRCGDEIPAMDPVLGQSEVYVAWSHPVYGGGEKIFCTNPTRECADRMLYSMGVGTTEQGAPDLSAPETVRAYKNRPDAALDWPITLVDSVAPSKLAALAAAAAAAAEPAPEP